MGKSYSYSIVVEQAGNLFMNNVEVPLPEEVVANGENPLGWALEQVRTVYASKFAEDENSELNLSVRDRRPGGLVRRAKFVHPDSGIDLDTFLRRREPPRGERAESPASEPAVKSGPNLLKAAQGVMHSKDSLKGQKAALDQQAQLLIDDAKTGAKYRDKSGELLPDAQKMAMKDAQKMTGVGQKTDRASKAQDAHLKSFFNGYRSENGSTHHRSDPQHPDNVPTASADEDVRGISGSVSDPEVKQARGVEVSAPLEMTSSAHTESSYEDKVRQERGWKKLPREKSNRPQVGSAENEGRSRKLGLLSEAKKQRTRNIIGIIVIVVVVIVGFRIFNGGTEYEALCVDQRTMTRTVTGVACESGTDTNHRWWFTADTENVPGPGDTIDTQKGTFDEPSGGKDTINYHVESEDTSE